LGHTLKQHAKPALLDALTDYVGYGREQVDLSSPDPVLRAMKDVRPDVVINAAAYTSLDAAEDHPELAFAVNAVAVGALAEQAKKQGCVLVHYSASDVFDGSASQPYEETDAVNPLSVYGQSKAAGEQYVQEVGGHAVVFRTGWMSAQRGDGFCKSIIQAARQNQPIRVMDDHVGVPTPANFLAELGLHVAGVVAMSRYKQRGKLPPSFLPDFPKDLPSGEVFHASASGQATWFEYANWVLEVAHAQGWIAQAPFVEAVHAASLAFKAPRPAYTLLNNAKLKSVFRVGQPDWRKAVKALVQGLPADHHGGIL
jgi:dTDP-4-dehydrorhamnose reductase